MYEDYKLTAMRTSQLLTVGYWCSRLLG